MINLFIKDIGGTWHELELKDESIATTFQSNNIGDISSRNASYSNKINIPRTPKNTQIFDFLGLNGNVSDYPYMATPIRVVIGGLEVIPNGVAYISETDDDYIFNFYDGLTALSDKLGDKKLADLDFSSVNHDLNYSELVNSFSNTSGFIYTPFAQYVSGLNIAYVDYMVPNLYWLWIWNKIFSESGFEYTGDFFSSNDATTMLVGMPTGGVTVNGTETVIYEQTPYAGSVTGPLVSPAGYYTTIFLNQFTTGDDDYKIYINNFTYHQSLGSAGNVGKLVVYRNSSVIHEVAVNQDSPINVDFDFYSNNGDNIGLSFLVYTSDPAIAWNLSAAVLKFSRTPHKVPINFSQLISDTKQIDFIKDAMIMFGLMSNYKNNVFEFRHIKDVLVTQSSATDWSSKLVDHNIKESYASDYGDLNAQNNRWKYQYYESESQDVINSRDGNISITNKNLPLENDFYNSIYKLPTGTHFDSMIAFDDSFNPSPSGLKLFYLNRSISGTFGWLFKGLDYGEYTYTGQIPKPGYASEAYPSNNISGNSFIARYYGELAYVLNRFKRCTMKMLLSPLDIYELDFNVLKYIKHTGKYYYLNKIKNFKVKPFKGKTVNSDTTVDVEMIEIPV